MKIKVSKFEPYPEINPTQNAVGFTISFENGRNFYIDTLVDLELEGDEAIEAAWEELEERINEKVERIGNLPSIVGGFWNPESHIIEIEEEEIIEPEEFEELEELEYED